MTASLDWYRQLENVLFTTGVGVWQWRVEEKSFLINAQCAAIMGYSHEQLPEVSFARWGKITHPDDMQGSIDKMMACVDGTTERYENEYRIQHQSGHWVWLKDSGCVVERDASGRALMMMGTHMDISAKKRADHRVERQQQMLEAMSKQAIIGAWEVDLVKGDVYWSSMTKLIHEVPESFVPSLEAGINFYKEGYSRDKITEVVQQGIADGKNWSVELQIVTALGNVKWVVATGSAIQVKGETIGLYGSFQDIDERKKSEQQLTQALADAEMAAKAKSEFLAMMSHEIRTPLNGVMGMLELLKRSKLDRQQQRKADIAMMSASTLLEVINDILDFSKVDAGVLVLNNQPTNLQHFIGDVAESMALRAQEKGLELILDFSDLADITVDADAGRIRQILVNLIGNAVKFTQQGEVIIRAVSTFESDRLQLHFDIEDTGLGIPADKLENVFSPFTQVDTSTTREYEGTGLGLAICKKLCTLMGGDVHVTSVLGKGSVFSFYISLDIAESASVVVDSVSSHHGKKVLFVHKQRHCSELLKPIFTAQGLHLSGTESLDQAELLFAQDSTPIDLLVIDRSVIDPGLENLDVSLLQDNQPLLAKYPGLQSLPYVVLRNMQDDVDTQQAAAEQSLNILKPLTFTDMQTILDMF